MEKTLTDSQTTSKNAFERFYELIERLRLNSSNKEFTEALNLLENTVLLQERKVQDLNDLKLSKPELEYINVLANDILDEFADLILRLPSAGAIIDSISYNLLASISLLNNITNDTDYFIRQFSRLSVSRKTASIIRNSENLTFALRSISGDLTSVSTDVERAIMELKQTISLRKDSNVMLQEINDSFMNRLVGDYFKLGKISELRNESIESIDNHINKINVTKKIEALFELDKNEYYVWDIELKFNSKFYSASKISYLLYSLSTSIESLGDIEVEINDWGTGSRWANLKVIIKDKAAKLDLIHLLKKFRQGIESVAHKKPLGEIKKAEAEADKLIKEIQNMPTKEHAEKLNEITVQEKLLDLEAKKEDIKSKKIENFTKLSQLIKDGVLSNDGDLQVFINSCLFVNITENSTPIASIKSLSEIEGKETKEKKADNDEGPKV